MGTHAPPQVRLALLAAMLTACGGGRVATDPTDPTLPNLVLTPISGGGQEGAVDETLPHPFVVRVTRSHGAAAANVLVTWRTTAGAGQLAAQPGPGAASTTSSTDADGRAVAWFTPLQSGTSIITAEITGLEIQSASFTVEASTTTTAVIRFGPLFDCPEPSIFSGPDGAADVTITLGMTVKWIYAEWLHASCRARIVSMAAPDDGFDSGELEPGQAFSFTPDRTGDWHYMDSYNGGAAWVHVR